MTINENTKGWCPECGRFSLWEEMTIYRGKIGCPHCGKSPKIENWGLTDSNKYPLDRIGVVDWFEPVMVNVDGEDEPKRLLCIYKSSSGLEVEFWDGDTVGCMSIDIEHVSHYEPNQHRELTHPEIFQHLVSKCIFKPARVYDEHTNWWSTGRKISSYKATPIRWYTNTDSDKWFPLTTELLDILEVDYEL